MPIIKCGECGRHFDLKPEQYGKVKCRCGAILETPQAASAALKPY